MTLDNTGKLTVDEIDANNMVIQTITINDINAVNVNASNSMTTPNLTATDITGTLQTGAQPNITSVGTLGNLNVTGTTTTNTLTASNVGGTLTTAAQPNITSLGTLTGLNVNGNIDGTNITASNNLVGNNVNALTVNSTTINNASGITTNSLNATNIAGTLTTASQQNITSVGILTNLNVSGNVGIGQAPSTERLNVNTGGGTTASAKFEHVGSNFIIRPNTAGSTTSVIENTGGGGLIVQPGPGNVGIGITPSSNAKLHVGGNALITGNLTATNIAGTLTTGTQPNITSVGTLTFLNVSGGITSNSLTSTSINWNDWRFASYTDFNFRRLTHGFNHFNLTSGEFADLIYLNGWTDSSGGARSIIAVAKSNNIRMRIYRTPFTNTLDTTNFRDAVLAEPNGDVSISNNLNVSNTITTNTLNASNLSLSGNVNVVNLTASGNITGATLTGTLTTASQPNITSVGTLTSITTSGNLTIADNRQLVIGPNGTTATPVRNFLNIQSFQDTERIIRLRRSGNNPTNVGLMISNFDANNYLWNPVLSNLELNYLDSTQWNQHGNFGTNILRITPAGNLGIGITPSERLHVNGNALISGNLTATNIAGTLTTASQPNITSVGTLTGLNVNGNIISNSLNAPFINYDDWRFTQYTDFNSRRISFGFGAFDMLTAQPSDLSDLIYLNGWTDSTGGQRNILSLAKGGAIRMRLYRTPYDDTLINTNYRDAVLAEPNGDVSISNNLNVSNTITTNTLTASNININDITTTNINAVNGNFTNTLNVSNSIGTTTMNGAEISVISGGGFDHFTIDQRNDVSTRGAKIVMRRGRGTLANPTQTRNGDKIASIAVAGYNGPNNTPTNEWDFIRVIAESDWTAPNNNSSIRFLTNQQTERMILDSSGNLGINITPSERLHVGGNVRIDNGNMVIPSPNGIFFNMLTDNAWKIYRASNADFTKSLATGFTFNINTFGSSSQGFAIGNGLGGVSYYEILGGNDTTTRHFMRGNLGINVVNANERLHINGNTRIEGATRMVALTNSSTRPAIGPTLTAGEIRGTSTSGNTFDDGFLRLSAGGGTNIGAQAGIDISGFSTVGDMNNNIRMYTNGQERLRININGNIGINDTAPTERLNVAGGIRSTFQSNNFLTGTRGTIMDFVPSSNLGRIGTVTGTGGSATSLAFLTDNTTRMTLNSNGLSITGNLTVNGNTEHKFYFKVPLNVNTSNTSLPIINTQLMTVPITIGPVTINSYFMGLGSVRDWFINYSCSIPIKNIELNVMPLRPVSPGAPAPCAEIWDWTTFLSTTQPAEVRYRLETTQPFHFVNLTFTT
jgi:hypothetical protein